MSILQAIVLGIVQGITEFLPISSDGHLALAEKYLGLQVPLAFDVMLHFGSLVAIVLVLWTDLWSLLGSRRRLILPLIAGTIPAGLAGVFLEKYLDTAKNDMLVVAASFMFTGIALAVGEFFFRRVRRKELTGVGFLDALIVGSAQAVALLPGVSRSGMTIASGLVRGLSREDCVRFSFLLAVPVMCGACTLKAREVLHMGSSLDMVQMIAATLVSFVFSAAALKLLLGIVRRVSVGVFSYYVLPLGMVLFVINAPAPVAGWMLRMFNIGPQAASIAAYVLIAVFLAVVIRFVFFGLLRREQSA